MSSLDPVLTVLDRLEGVRKTAEGQYMARCPAHDDKHASLSVGQGEDGRAMINCHAGCARGDMLEAIGLCDSDLFPPDPAGRPAARPPAMRRNPRLAQAPKGKYAFKTPDDAFSAIARITGGQLVAAWQYPGDAFRVARFALPDGSKTFRPIHHNGAGWLIGDPPGFLPLYRGDDLPGDGPTIIAEGETCVDAARGVGLTAVTSAHGCGSAHRSNWKPLAGREVVVLPDSDGGGRKYAVEVATILTALEPPCVVRVVDLPDLPEHGDIVDWIAPDGPMGCKTAEEIKAAVVGMAKDAPPWTPKADANASAPAGGPVLVSLADVEAKPVRWLWPSRIAIGKLTLIAGDPGLGKSFLTLDMAARVSKGDGWPDFPASASAPGGVVLLSAEDDLEDTIKPRLIAAGADVSRIKALVAVKHFDFEAGGERQHPFNLAQDLAALEQAVEDVADCRLVVIDPISAYLGRTDSHKNAEIRGLLAPLSELVARRGAALVAVTHLRKGEGPAMYRPMGSLGFVAAARAAYAVTKDKGDPSGLRRFMLPVKNNVGNDRDGLAYCLDDTFSANGQPVVKWEAHPVSVSANEALRPDNGRPEADTSERDEAEAWLQDALAEGPQAAKDIIAQARQDGISKRTLDRAKKVLGVVAAKEGFYAGWTWRLPGTPTNASHGEDGEAQERQGPRQKDVATFADVGNIREKSKESGGFDDTAEGGLPEGCQARQTGNLPLDADRPGPVDLLDPEQRKRYLAIYRSRPASMPPAEKHALAWRVALGGTRP